MDKKAGKVWLRFFTILLLCTAMLILTLGTAYARYEKNTEQNLAITYQGQENQMKITLVDAGAEALAAAAQSGAQAVEFILANGTSEESFCTYDQAATLAMFATIGIENPENLVMTLYDNGFSYTAVCSQVLEGSAYYKMYGPGWIYRFYTEDGEEVSWNFPGVQYIERQMYITIAGSSSLPANLSLVTSAKPSN